MPIKSVAAGQRASGDWLSCPRTVAPVVRRRRAPGVCLPFPSTPRSGSGGLLPNRRQVTSLPLDRAILPTLDAVPPSRRSGGCGDAPATSPGTCKRTGATTSPNTAGITRESLSSVHFSTPAIFSSAMTITIEEQRPASPPPGHARTILRRSPRGPQRQRRAVTSPSACAPGRTRTCGQVLRRHLLYPLSYGGRSPSRWAGSPPG